MVANEHVYITPGSDALFLLALLNTLFREDRANPDRLKPLLDDWDTIERHIEPYTPEKVATHTGVSADVIKRIAREFADELSVPAATRAIRADAAQLQQNR